MMRYPELLPPAAAWSGLGSGFPETERKRITLFPLQSLLTKALPSFGFSTSERQRTLALSAKPEKEFDDFLLSTGLGDDVSLEKG